MFSYSVDVELQDLAPLLGHIVATVFDEGGAEDARRLVEELQALPRGERLGINIESDEPTPLRVTLVLERSGPSVCTLMAVSDDEAILADITAATRRFMDAPPTSESALDHDGK